MQYAALPKNVQSITFQFNIHPGSYTFSSTTDNTIAGSEYRYKQASTTRSGAARRANLSKMPQAPQHTRATRTDKFKMTLGDIAHQGAVVLDIFDYGYPAKPGTFSICPLPKPIVSRKSLNPSSLSPANFRVYCQHGRHGYLRTLRSPQHPR